MSHRLTLITTLECANRLTDREAEVLDLLHLHNREIAEELAISPATVKRHISSALTKLGTETRVGAALAWRDRRAA